MYILSCREELEPLITGRGEVVVVVVVGLNTRPSNRGPVALLKVKKGADAVQGSGVGV